MKGRFAITVEAFLSEVWTDFATGDPSLDYIVTEARVAWNHDAVYDFLLQTPDAVRDLAYEHCTEIGTYEMTGDYWMTDNEDDYGDIDLDNVEVKKLVPEPVLLKE